MKHENITVNGRAVLRTYLLDKSEELGVAARPAVIVFPGGAYLFCSDRESEAVALSFNQAGFDAYVLTYTTGRGFKEAYKDADAAMHYIKEHQTENGINSLIVCGFSAGAHLACSIGTMCGVKPDGMILVYPPLLAEEWADAAGDVIGLLDKIDERTPKTFIVHAYDDPIVPVHNAYRLMEALDRHNIEFEAHVFRSGGHGFSIASPCVGGGDPAYEKDVKALWVPLAVSWINNAVARIEFVKKETVDESRIPELLKKTLGELVSNQKIKEYFFERKSPLLNPKMYHQLCGVPFSKILIGMGVSLSDMESLADELEKLE